MHSFPVGVCWIHMLQCELLHSTQCWDVFSVLIEAKDLIYWSDLLHLKCDGMKISEQQSRNLSNLFNLFKWDLSDERLNVHYVFIFYRKVIN